MLKKVYTTALLIISSLLLGYCGNNGYQIQLPAEFNANSSNVDFQIAAHGDSAVLDTVDQLDLEVSLDEIEYEWKLTVGTDECDNVIGFEKAGNIPGGMAVLNCGPDHQLIISGDVEQPNLQLDGPSGIKNVQACLSIKDKKGRIIYAQDYSKGCQGVDLEVESDFPSDKIEALEEQIKVADSKDASLKEKEEALSSKEKELSDKEIILDSKEKELADKESVLAAKEKELAAKDSSKSTELTKTTTDSGSDSKSTISDKTTSTLDKTSSTTTISTLSSKSLR